MILRIGLFVGSVLLSVLFLIPGGLRGQDGVLDLSNYELNLNESSSLEFSLTIARGPVDFIEIRNPFESGPIAIESIQRQKPGFSFEPVFTTTDSNQFSRRKVQTALVTPVSKGSRVSLGEELASGTRVTLRIRISTPRDATSSSVAEKLRVVLGHSNRRGNVEELVAKKTFQLKDKKNR